MIESRIATVRLRSPPRRRPQLEVVISRQRSAERRSGSSASQADRDPGRARTCHASGSRPSARRRLDPRQLHGSRSHVAVHWCQDRKWPSCPSTGGVRCERRASNGPIDGKGLTGAVQAARSTARSVELAAGWRRNQPCDHQWSCSACDSDHGKGRVCPHVRSTVGLPRPPDIRKSRPETGREMEARLNGAAALAFVSKRQTGRSLSRPARTGETSRDKRGRHLLTARL